MRVTYLRNIPIKEKERNNLNIRVEEYYREKRREILYDLNTRRNEAHIYQFQTQNQNHTFIQLIITKITYFLITINFIVSIIQISLSLA